MIPLDDGRTAREGVREEAERLLAQFNAGLELETEYSRDREAQCADEFRAEGWDEEFVRFFTAAPRLVRSLLALLQQHEAPQWQPIATAPKDGTWLLLAGGAIDYGWDGDDQPSCVAGQWTTELNGQTREKGCWQFAWYDGGYYGEYEAPTHWQHLPPVPDPQIRGVASQETERSR